MSTIKNVGELRALIAELPDDLRIHGSIEIYTQPPSPLITCESVVDWRALQEKLIVEKSNLASHEKEKRGLAPMYHPNCDHSINICNGRIEILEELIALFVV